MKILSLVLFSLLVFSAQSSAIECSDATITTTVSNNLYGPSGGAEGEWFSDETAMGNNSIQEVRVNSGDYVDSIEVIYDNRVIDPTKPGDQNSAAGMHGGDGGSTSILRLEEGEYITRIGGRYGTYVDSLYFETNLGQTVITGSDGGALDFSYTVSEGSEIQGVFGLVDEYVNAIGVIVRSTHNDVVCND